MLSLRYLLTSRWQHNEPQDGQNEKWKNVEMGVDVGGCKNISVNEFCLYVSIHEILDSIISKMTAKERVDVYRGFRDTSANLGS